MTRLVSEHFRRDGRPKVEYPTKHDALAHSTGNVTHAYKCGFCGRWHLATSHRS